MGNLAAPFLARSVSEGDQQPTWARTEREAEAYRGSRCPRCWGDNEPVWSPSLTLFEVALFIDFRDRAGKFINDLHEQLVTLAIEQGHTEASTAALDGSSVAACASRHRMVNQSTLEKRKTLLDDVICGRLTDELQIPQWVRNFSKRSVKR